MHDRCNNFEGELKKWNLIFDIPKHQENTNLEEYIIYVIVNVMKVGVFVQFANLRKKIEVLAARKNLQGKNIYVCTK